MLVASQIVDHHRKLTVVDARRNAATSGSVDVANVLLQAGVGSAALAVGNGTAGVLGRWSREGERRKGESDGESELHDCGGC
jgi:hypothetical protein